MYRSYRGAIAAAFLLGLVASVAGNVDAEDISSVGKSRKAWVSILTADSFNHTEMLATQILSVQKFSSYKEHVTMVLPTVSEDIVSYISGLDTHIVQVDRIESPFFIERSWWRDVFAKLHAVNLIEYDQVVYLDSDAFIQSTEADLIFDECQADMCGVQDTIDVHFKGDKARYTMMNAGVLVIRPSAERFRYLVEEALPQARPHFLPEQGFFADAYVKKSFGEAVGRIQWLDWRYNTCAASYFGLVTSCEAESEEEVDSSACTKRVRDQVKIFHGCGDVKMNAYPLCAWDNSPEKAHFCSFKDIVTYQDLLQEVNPCVLGNLDETSCVEARSGSGQCQWCASASRCLLPELECSTLDRDSVKVKERLEVYEKFISKKPGHGPAFGPALDDGTNKRILTGSYPYEH